VRGQSVATGQYVAEARPGGREAWAHLRGYVAALLLRVGVASASPFLAYLCYRAWVERAVWLVALYSLSLAILLLAAFWRGATHRAQSSVLLAVVYGLALVTQLRGGSAGQGQVFLVAGIALATLLLGRGAGLALLLASIVLLIIGSRFWAGGALSLAGEHLDNEASRYAWATDALLLAAVGGTLTFAVDYVVTGLVAALDAMERRTSRLERQDEVLGREREELERENVLLSRRSDKLRTSASVALGIAPGVGEQELLERAARLTSERFGFYHVGIFVLDPTGEWAELRAASSEGGRRMLARRHRLRVGQEGLIGYVTARGEARITVDADVDALYYENPDLPETRSEAAVPLRYQGRVIGALDIQEPSRGAFQDEDIIAIQVLGDLIAAALKSAQLIETLQEGVAAERRSYAELSTRAWLERARATRDIGYRYEQGRVSRLTRPGTDGEPGSPEGGLVQGKQTWPLGVRGRLIGSVEAHKDAEQGEWSPAERELMQTVIEQLGAALESARLYEDARFRASGDRLVAEVTGRIRETLDLDTVLRTVADEIYDALELDEIVVHLVPPAGGEDLGSEG
jgi:GAF domain-containing protein